MKLLLFTQLPVILVSFDEVGHKKTRLISIMSKPISIVVEVVVVVVVVKKKARSKNGFNIRFNIGFQY